VSSVAVRSDPGLLAEIRRYGRFDTTGCFQCGTCTLSCDLARGAASFPRRIIRYGLLGLRAPLVASLDPWLCHDCGDCTTACPRQAEPQVSVETLRRFLIAQYDWTGLAARFIRSRAWHLGSVGFVFALVLGLVVVYHVYRLPQVGLPLRGAARTPLGFAHMFPMMTYFTLTVVLVPLFFLASHAIRMWLFAMGPEPTRIPLRHYLAEIRTYVVESATQEQMAECPEKRQAWIRHLMMVAGTVLMLVIVVFFLRWFQVDGLYPLYHPQRWLGYLATALMLYGSGAVLADRLTKRAGQPRAEIRDLVFPALLFLTAATGIAVHLLRYAGLALTAHYAYAIHIAITVAMLVVEVPFGKLSHMVYRPLALYLQAVKERAAAAPTGEAVPAHG